LPKPGLCIQGLKFRVRPRWGGWRLPRTEAGV
jgi:hypothetical protein